MKLVINIEKRYFFFIVGILILLVGIIAVTARSHLSEEIGFAPASIPASKVVFEDGSISPSNVDFTDTKNQPCSNICKDANAQTLCDDGQVLTGSGCKGYHSFRFLSNVNLNIALALGFPTCNALCSAWEMGCTGGFALTDEDRGSSTHFMYLDKNTLFEDIPNEVNENIWCFCKSD